MTERNLIIQFMISMFTYGRLGPICIPGHGVQDDLRAH
jgi:hypothetical protein